MGRTDEYNRPILVEKVSTCSQSIGKKISEKKKIGIKMGPEKARDRWRAVKGPVVKPGLEKGGTEKRKTKKRLVETY